MQKFRVENEKRKVEAAKTILALLRKRLIKCVFTRVRVFCVGHVGIVAQHLLSACSRGCALADSRDGDREAA